MVDQEDSWPEHRRLVLHELMSLRSEVAAIRDSQVNIREDIAGLKVRAGLIGGVAGAVSAFFGHLLGKT